MSSTLLAVVLQQKKTLVDYVGHDEDSALYMVPVDETTTAMPLRVLLPMSAYDDFGRPEQLTVTIRPGNGLNDTDSAFQTPAEE